MFVCSYVLLVPVYRSLEVFLVSKFNTNWPNQYWRSNGVLHCMALLGERRLWEWRHKYHQWRLTYPSCRRAWFWVKTTCWRHRRLRYWSGGRIFSRFLLWRIFWCWTVVSRSGLARLPMNSFANNWRWLRSFLVCFMQSRGLRVIWCFAKICFRGNIGGDPPWRCQGNCGWDRHSSGCCNCALCFVTWCVACWTWARLCCTRSCCCGVLTCNRVKL